MHETLVRLEVRELLESRVTQYAREAALVLVHLRGVALEAIAEREASIAGGAGVRARFLVHAGDMLLQVAARGEGLAAARALESNRRAAVLRRARGGQRRRRDRVGVVVE